MELKNLVTAGTSAANTKMNKSGILKKSIDKIRSLEEDNVELKMENQRLRHMLNLQTIPDAFDSPLSPPISDSSSPRPQSIEQLQMNLNRGVPSIQAKSQANESDQQILFIQRGVSPHTKFALCIFMFAVISLNSFGSLITLNGRSNVHWNNDEINAGSARRTILSTVIDDVSCENICVICHAVFNHFIVVLLSN